MRFHILGPDDPALAALSQFLLQHPEYETDLTVVAWDHYQATLLEALQAGESPYQAVFVPGHVWLADLVTAGKLVPLPIQKISPEVWEQYQAEDIFHKIQEECQYNQESYLIPYFTDGHLLFYRNDLISFENTNSIPIISPQQMEALVKNIHHPPALFGLALKAAPSEIFLDWLPFLWAFGGDVLDSQHRPILLSQPSIFALETYCGLRQYCPPDVSLFGNAEIAAVLRAKTVSLAPTWGGQAALIFPDQGSSHSYSTALYPTPWNATWGIGIPRNQSKVVQIRMTETLYRINQLDMDQKVLEIAGSPVRKSTYSQANLQKFFWLEAQWEMLHRCRTLPVTPKLGKILGVLYPAIYAAFCGEKSPQQALADAQLELERIL